MGLDKILSISGKPGLFELVAKTRNGFIAKSLIDGKKIPVNIQNNVSMLSEIAIYTYTEEVPLKDVLKRMHEQAEGKQTIDHKSSKTELESYFSDILPEYDEDRVYASDIKKVVQWYNILVSQNLLEFTEETDETNSEVNEAETNSANN
ncbi:DUF5606 domain-containing protein [Psychroflexus sp. ALD_RP9]|uniref:DUF5606 family protein n=1 Tax=Psychroflexus sp. ALD_RP9 TaxID=2777186 RepID=UPI001A8DB8AA|nr:DUF5606 domain-containing protein [Psychroflexus sp. ALD_RP9]QSS96850.1 DUF5606 domain-containing protein [Psychroflexus sp. ALD_RP9]